MISGSAKQNEEDKARGNKELLTGNSLGPLVGRNLKLANGLTKSLVSGYEGHDGEQREDERERGIDVPPAVDNAEVLGVPCEEHLDHRV